MNRLVKTPSGEIISLSGGEWSKTKLSSSKLESTGTVVDTSLTIQSSIQIYG